MIRVRIGSSEFGVRVSDEEFGAVVSLIKSSGGRFDPASKTWSLDYVTPRLYQALAKYVDAGVASEIKRYVFEAFPSGNYYVVDPSAAPRVDLGATTYRRRRFDPEAREYVEEEVRLHIVKDDGSILVPRGLAARALRNVRFKPFRPGFTVKLSSGYRQYQVEVLNSVVEDLRLQGASTVMMATGGGKSYMVAGFIKDAIESGAIKRAYYLAMSLDLVNQFAEFAEKWGLKVGVVSGEEKDFGKPVVAATVQTLYRAIKTVENIRNGGDEEVEEEVKAYLDEVELTQQEMQRLYNDYKSVDLVTIDECLPYNALVVTDRGLLPIGEIVEKRLPVRVLTHKGRFMRITNYYKIPLVKRLVRIVHEMGELIVTEDHLILTQDGWKPAIDLKSRDVVYFYAVQMQNLREGVSNAFGSSGSLRNGSQPSGSETKSAETMDIVQGESCGGDKNGCTKERDEEVSVITKANRETEGNSPGDGAWGWSFINTATQSKKRKIKSSALFRPVQVLNVEILRTNEHSKNPTKVRAYEEIRRIWGRDYLPYNMPSRANGDLQGIVYKWEEDRDQGTLGYDKDTNSVSGLVSGRWVNKPIRGEKLLYDTITYGGLYIGGEQNAGSMVGERVGGGVQHNTLPQLLSSPYAEYERGGEIPRINQTNSIRGVSGEEEFVYDIEVEEDHSFVADGVVVHNCHHLPVNTVRTVVRANPNSLRVSLSATPFRNDGRDLEIYAYGGLITRRVVTSSELIRGGYLVPAFIIMWRRETPCHVDAGEECRECIRDCLRSGGEYEECVDECREGGECEASGARLFASVKRCVYNNEGRNRDIVEIAKALPKPVLVLTKEVAPARRLNELIRDAGLRSEVVTGAVKGSRREEVFNMVRRERIDVLVADTIADEGLDLPALKSLLITGGGKSKTRTLQRVGRVVRPWEGKEFAVVVDIWDLADYFIEHGQERMELYKMEPEWRIKTVSGPVTNVLNAIKSLMVNN